MTLKKKQKKADTIHSHPCPLGKTKYSAQLCAVHCSDTEQRSYNTKPRNHEASSEQAELRRCRCHCGRLGCLGHELRHRAGADSSVARVLGASLAVAKRVIVVQTSWLQKGIILVVQHGDVKSPLGELLAGNDGADDQGEEDNEHGKIEDRVSDDTSPPQLGLLHRIDRGPDLATGVPKC